MNHTTITETEIIDNEIADCLQETQWVIENIIMETAADLLDQAWQRLKWQLRPNPILTS